MTDEIKPDTLKKLSGLARRALEIAQRNDVLGADRQLAREIGHAAYEIAGLRGMQCVYAAIDSVWRQGYFAANPVLDKNKESFHPAVFQAAWDGVGTWRW